jgi:hypothetical protein
MKIFSLTEIGYFQFEINEREIKNQAGKHDSNCTLAENKTMPKQKSVPKMLSQNVPKYSMLGLLMMGESTK